MVKCWRSPLKAKDCQLIKTLLFIEQPSIYTFRFISLVFQKETQDDFSVFNRHLGF